MNSLTLAAPAKINVILKVISRRTDGYHELETIMHTISLADQIHVGTTPGGITVESNSSAIPAGQDNLAYRAAALYMERTGTKAGVKIFIEKNIPVGAGLAGGSTDAAAVLKALEYLFPARLAPGELQSMAAVIGSDVAFCLQEGTAIARGRGELLTPLDDRGPMLDLVLVVPDFQVSTAEVYQAYEVSHDHQNIETAAFVDAWRNRDISSMAPLIYNDLEAVSLTKHNEIGQIKTGLKQAGALNALMSGSGPAVFGIFIDPATAEKAANIMGKNFRQVYQVTSYYRE